MPPSNPAVQDRAKPEDSPIVWFSELLIASSRNDYEKAVQAQRQLRRLGWSVYQRQPHRAETRGGAR